MKPKKRILEELLFVKEGRVEDKVFYIFQNPVGELRAVEAAKVKVAVLQPGDKIKAWVARKGCAGREIEQVEG